MTERTVLAICTFVVAILGCSVYALAVAFCTGCLPPKSPVDVVAYGAELEGCVASCDDWTCYDRCKADVQKKFGIDAGKP